MKLPRTAIWPTTARTIWAFWASPLAAPILYTLLERLVVGISGHPILGFREFISEVAAVSLYILPISYAGLLVLGLPSLVLLEMLGRLNLFRLIVVAAVEGVIVASL